MIIKAIKTDQIPFIFQVFQMNKNYELIEEEISSSDESLSETEGNYSPRESIGGNMGNQYNVFTYNLLLENIVDYSTTKESLNKRVEEVANWKLRSSESFLKSMLINRQDKIAADCAEFYQQDIDVDLLKYAIFNSNEIFLKYAFKNGHFEDYITRENPELIEYLL
jgi:hypothetical protein